MFEMKLNILYLEAGEGSSYAGGDPYSSRAA